MDFVKALSDIVEELVKNKQHLKVLQMTSLEEDTVVLHVYCDKSDLAALIGRKGNMANSIRQLMSVSGRLSNTKLEIKFDSYDY